jgi:5'-3' exonuclease|tara:strand:+ start:4866 stop:5750 length:885 start_codon:yes stop_codon:yes gene_type:complete
VGIANRKKMEFAETLKKQEHNENLIIVDGLNIAFRWRYKRVPYYTNDYVRTVESLAKSYNCGNMIILADGGSTYRKNIYPEYKGNRKDKYDTQTETEKKEFEQFLGEFANAFKKLKSKGYMVLKNKGLEADDLAAWIVGKKEEFNIGDIWLISSDKDWDLLIRDGVSRFSTVTRKEITIDNWEEHYDVEPDKYLTLKCLAGDTGDNIPGIAGIGPKRAVSLINDYGDLYDIYNSCPIDSKYKFIQSLNENADRLLLNAELMDLESYSEQAIIESGMNIEDLSSDIKGYLNGSNN